MSCDKLYPCLVLFLVYFLMPSGAVTWHPDIPFQKVKAVEGSSAIFAWNITFDNTNTGIVRTDIERIVDPVNDILENIIYRLASDANATVPISSYRSREKDLQLQIVYHTPSNTARVVFTLHNVNFTADNGMKFMAKVIFSPNFVSQFRSADLEVQDVPELTMEILPNKTKFCRGEQIHVNCSAKAKPQANYSLYQNDKPISSSRTGYFIVDVNMSGNITITCVPSNEAGIGENISKRLEVKEPPKIIRCQILENGKEKSYVVEGRKVELKCNVSGSEPLKKTWTNGQQVWNENSVVFQPVNRSDTGTYYLTVSNGEECKTKTSLILDVYYVPESTTMKILPNKTKFCRGEQIQVKCLSMRARPVAVKYSVYQNDKLINSRKDFIGGRIVVPVVHKRVIRSIKVTFRVIVPVVIIDYIIVNVSVSGNITITCVPSNEAGVGKNISKRVAVEEPPAISNCTKLINNTYLAYGAVSEKDNVKLMCNISGSKPLNVLWRYGSKEWFQEYLKLPYINRKDAGTYEIRVKSGGVCNQTAKQNMTLEVYCLKDDSLVQEYTTLVAVLGALLALSIVLNILLIVGFLWICRKDSKGNSEKRSNKSEERGQTNDISLQEKSFTAKDNTPPNVPEYEPIERRGLATSNAGFPQYEAVTTRTQPPQPQSGIQTNNPMPHESADGQGQTGAVVNAPPVTYQTIQPRTGDYGSLSPLTRLPPKDAILSSTGSPSLTGEYQTLQHRSVSPHYQSLDDLSKC